MAQRTCEQCGTRYQLRRHDQRFCSKRCRNTSARQHNPRTCGAPECERPHLARGLCSTHYNQTHLTDRHRSKGDPERRRRQLRAKTARRRAAVYDPQADVIDHWRIGERDQWRCGICRKRIDPTVRYPHPLSASLDHVVPLSLGGKHTAANVRITHLTCNLARSNRGGGEQLAIVG